MTRRSISVSTTRVASVDSVSTLAPSPEIQHSCTDVYSVQLLRAYLLAFLHDAARTINRQRQVDGPGSRCRQIQPDRVLRPEQPSLPLPQSPIFIGNPEDSQRIGGPLSRLQHTTNEIARSPGANGTSNNQSLHPRLLSVSSCPRSGLVRETFCTVHLILKPNLPC